MLVSESNVEIIVPNKLYRSSITMYMLVIFQETSF